MARPCRYDRAASERVVIRVTPAQKAALEQMAAENNMQVSTVVRDAVNEYVADYAERQVFVTYAKTVRLVTH